MLVAELELQEVLAVLLLAQLALADHEGAAELLAVVEVSERAQLDRLGSLSGQIHVPLSKSALVIGR